MGWGGDWRRPQRQQDRRALAAKGKAIEEQQREGEGRGGDRKRCWHGGESWGCGGSGRSCFLLYSSLNKSPSAACLSHQSVHFIWSILLTLIRNKWPSPHPFSLTLLLLPLPNPTTPRLSNPFCSRMVSALVLI